MKKFKIVGGGKFSNGFDMVEVPDNELQTFLADADKNGIQVEAVDKEDEDPSKISGINTKNLFASNNQSTETGPSQNNQETEETTDTSNGEAPTVFGPVVEDKNKFDIVKNKDQYSEMFPDGKIEENIDKKNGKT